MIQQPQRRRARAVAISRTVDDLRRAGMVRLALWLGCAFAAADLLLVARQLASH